MPHEHLTIEDMSDREFLLVLDDHADEDGWTDSQTIADALDLAERRVASSRLSWLRRWGAVEREVERDEAGNIRVRRNGQTFYTQRWRLTDVGAALAHGHLLARQQQSLERLEDAQMLEVTRWVTERARRVNGTAGKLMAREWRYGMSTRR